MNPKLDKSAAAVSQMFGEIAPTYDLLNHLLCANQDKRWRRRAIARLCPRAGEKILDLCCGSGDLTREIARQQPRCQSVGADFALPMLQIARAKNLPALACADALQLPFGDAIFDAVAVAFGARNFADTRAGLDEMFRVTKRGGRVLVLEFMRPTSNIVARGAGAGNLVLAPIGRAISGHQSAYSYLPQSIDDFYTRREFEGLLREIGWTNVRSFEHAFGVATRALWRGDCGDFRFLQRNRRPGIAIRLTSNDRTPQAGVAGVEALMIKTRAKKPAICSKIAGFFDGPFTFCPSSSFPF